MKAPRSTLAMFAYMTLCTRLQGDIESVAALSAKDLTALIEQVSGSAAFKKEYDKCEVNAFQHSWCFLAGGPPGALAFNEAVALVKQQMPAGHTMRKTIFPADCTGRVY